MYSEMCHILLNNLDFDDRCGRVHEAAFVVVQLLFKLKKKLKYFLTPVQNLLMCFFTNTTL